MRRSAIALFILALLLISALPPQAQMASQPSAISLFGMNTYFTGYERVSRDGDAGVAALVGKGRQIGVAWGREELSWGNIERDGKGIWSWSIFDTRLGQAAQAGYGMIGMLLTTPAWARVSDCSQRIQRYAYAGVVAADYWCPPANPQDFADYVRAVVERYDGDGISDAPGSPRVAAWQLWNEPNAWETWPGSPAEFAAIWQVGYTAAKAADPSAIVASPGIYVFDGQWQDGVGHGDGLRFLDQALAARPALWFSFDALAIHPYLPDVAPDQPGLYASISFWGRMSTARSWLSERTARYGGAPKPLWISEVGWSTCTAAQADCYTRAAVGAAGAAQAPAVFLGPMAMGTPPATTQVAALPNALIGKSEAQQADYLVRAYALAMAIGVQHLSWFQLEDKFDGAAHNFWEEAAIFGTVAEGYRAKPAAQAYATLSGLLAGGRFTGFGALNTFSYTPNVLSPQARFHLRFVSADNRQIDLLWRNADAEVVDLPLEPGRGAELRDRAGSVLGLTLIGGAARLTVGESPLYLIQSLSPGLQVIPSGVYALMQPDEPPTQLTITVANNGSGAISWSATSNAAWLSVQTPAGQGYASPLTFSIDPSGLGLGSHSATLRVSSGALAQDVPITLMIIEQVWRQRLPFVAR